MDQCAFCGDCLMRPTTNREDVIPVWLFDYSGRKDELPSFPRGLSNSQAHRFWPKRRLVLPVHETCNSRYGATLEKAASEIVPRACEGRALSRMDLWSLADWLDKTRLILNCDAIRRAGKDAAGLEGHPVDRYIGRTSSLLISMRSETFLKAVCFDLCDPAVALAAPLAFSISISPLTLLFVSNADLLIPPGSNETMSDAVSSMQHSLGLEREHVLYFPRRVVDASTGWHVPTTASVYEIALGNKRWRPLGGGTVLAPHSWKDHAAKQMAAMRLLAAINSRIVPSALASAAVPFDIRQSVQGRLSSYADFLSTMTRDQWIMLDRRLAHPTYDPSRGWGWKSRPRADLVTTRQIHFWQQYPPWITKRRRPEGGADPVP